MTILALETSTPQASLAVWRDATVVREWSFQSDRAHNSLLFAPLAEALELYEPDCLAVGTGPGSYAGVRIALSAALGLSIAKNLPLIGWPSLTAFDLPGGCGIVVGDARRGGCFVGEIVDGRLVGLPVVVSPAEAREHAKDGAVYTFDAMPPLPEAVQVTPTAAWLARRIAALTGHERRALAAVAPEPLYLRAPFVTTPKPRMSTHGPKDKG